MLTQRQRSVNSTGWRIKKWTISFRCLQCVYHIRTENFCNTSTLLQHLKHWSKCSSFTARTEASHFWNCPTAHSIKCVRCSIPPEVTTKGGIEMRLLLLLLLHVYLEHHELCHKEYLTRTTLQRIWILYYLQILPLASVFYKNETISSKNLRKLCSQTPRQSTFFCATL